MESICLIVHNYYDIDPRVRRKAGSLIDAGYCVDVIAMRPTSRNKKRMYELDGVHVFTLPLQKKRGSIARYIFEYFAFFIMAFLKVSVMMLRKKYKVIDVNSIPDFLVFSALIPKILGARVILDMHEIMPEFYVNKYHVRENHWLIKLIKLQERISIFFADHVLTINEPIQKLLQTRGLKPEKSTIITNSVDEKLFSRAQSKTSKHDSKKFIMMYHGTLTPLYGLDIALNAFALVHKEIPEAEFWIIGDGTERAKLEELVYNQVIEEKVKFFGVVPQQEIPKWLSKCDMGIMATRQDKFLDLSFSNKLPEYIVMGKPVIISRLKTINYYFSENALTFFKPHNVSNLAQKMLELYKNPELRKKKADQAVKEYAKINWSIMERRYLNAINM